MVFCILVETTLPTKAPRGMEIGGQWTKFHPGISLVFLSSSSESLERSCFKSCSEFKEGPLDDDDDDDDAALVLKGNRLIASIQQ